MINPSIESSEIPIWHQIIFGSEFCNFCEKQTKRISRIQIYGVCTHTITAIPAVVKTIVSDVNQINQAFSDCIQEFQTNLG